MGAARPGRGAVGAPGERLHIHVLNADPDACHSFHLHGLRYGIDSDGAWPFGVGTTDGRRSDEILPGERWTYVFDATEETIGAWGFHDHVHDVGAFVNRGLFGGLIVRDPRAECVDHEIPMFVHQMVGSGISCRFLSPTLKPGPPPAAGDFFEFTFGTEPGICRYHCQIHGTMMSGQVVVDPAGPMHRDVSAQNNQFTPQVATVAPGGTVRWTNNETEAGHDHIVIADGGGAATYCLNGRAYRRQHADDRRRRRRAAALVPVQPGPRRHLAQLPSAFLTLAAAGAAGWRLRRAQPQPGGVLRRRDRDAAAPSGCPASSTSCSATHPKTPAACRLKGDFLFHCHIEEHMMAGLAGLVRSREYAWLTRDLAKSLSLELPLDDGRNECPVVDLERCTPKRRPPRGRGRDRAMAGMPMPGPGPTPGVDLSHAAARGVFELLPCDSQVLAVHAALMHTGKVLFFAGSGNDELYTTGLRSVVWDYEAGGFHKPYTPIDVFCAHQSFLGDGRLLVVGGTETYAFTGLRTTYAFDPGSEEWIRLADMSTGRWYPTAMTLDDGRVLAAGGTGDLQHQVEIYSPLTGWAPPIPRTHDWGAFPNLILMRDGRVFFTGAHFDGFARTPFIFDVVGHSETPVGGLTPPDSHGMAPSVLLPPAQAQKVMTLGGGGPAGPVADVNLVDLSVAAPSYVAGPPMAHRRTMQNAVVLPDRTVFVSGGGLEEDPSKAELRSEIYDPSANAWRPGATAVVPRLYHSVALLLPDGRVITAGSNPHRRDDELRLELYHPPYLFRGPRPFIEAAPSAVTHGEAFEIHTPQADAIRWVQLIKPMAVTHSCDTEQRLVDLPIRRGERLLRSDGEGAARAGTGTPGLVHALHHQPRRRPFDGDLGSRDRLAARRRSGPRRPWRSPRFTGTQARRR